jgi:signal transduction histidine kinase
MTPDHGVQFYQDDAFLVEVLVAYVDQSLQHCAGILLIVTADHGDAVLRAGRSRGLPCDAALDRGQLLMLDASATLAGLLDGGAPDPMAFERKIRPLVELLLARYGSVRVYGEMVDLLWRSGQREATMALESLWNRMLVGLPVELLCGYHLDGFTSDSDFESFQGICQAHGQIHACDAPNAGYGLVVSSFQQQAQALGEATVERQQAEQSLEQATAELSRANADLKRLLHVASHDLQEPLRRGSLHLDLLTTMLQDLDGPACKHLTEAIECLGVMRQRVAAMRSLAEIVDCPAPQRQFPAEAALAEALQRLDPQIQATGARLRCMPLPQVVGDQAQLAEVFVQLLANALVHRGEQPPAIRIAVHGHDDGIAFSVSDNGVGIPAGQRLQVFQLFSRLDHADAQSHAGAGLTLALKIVERHGGRIWIDQAAEGGTVVRFSWPAQPRES